MTRRSARRDLLLSRETVLGLLVVLLLAAVCVVLGMWQFHRYEDKRDAAAVVETHYGAEPVALEEVLATPQSTLSAEDDWTPVALRGEYCTAEDCVLYVRNRTLGGDVGFWQLAPFRSEDGVTLLVVRGWVPEGEGASAPLDPPAVPAGEHLVTVHLRPAEPALDREIPEGQAHSVNPPQIGELLGEDESTLVTHAYGVLETEEPSAERPEPLPEPDTSLGPHLSYAVQWWVFAAFFPAALVYRVRKQIQDLDALEQDAADEDTAPAEQDAVTARSHPHRPRRAHRTRRRGQDEEEEDALIDQQHP
ncbi:SURF1 family protein [Brachybacterium sp. YJGR34]|uniref:SURF1 family cytochrome oxidase biogenesis protein n=1 Tax=Brachybacterium sp. YJGR34 TaxID=2059911 RepID=UPI000E0AFEDF|nr:SURF1 family protein [Brachybacterium sp. YJGR34]